MNSRTERDPYRELDDDERYYATAPIDEIRRELEHHGVRVEPTIAAVRALIDERTPRVTAAETTYLSYLATFDRIAAYTARRNRLTADQTAEFVQIVRGKLFENDYAIIRKFEDRSRFTTYLTTVIARLFHQWRVEQSAKWRPSARARALGEKAITLERLMSRDGLSFSEAVATLTQRHPQNFSVEELEAIHVQLLLSDEHALAELPSEESAEERVRTGERAIAARAAVAALDRAMGDFSPEDRLILQLRFESGRKVPEIARILDLEPKQLYKRLDRLFKTLRRTLEEAGIDRAVIGELMELEP